MIFSIFGSKKKSSAAARKRGDSKDLDALKDQREIARQTAEKIDQIESEMDLGSPRGQVGRVATPSQAVATRAAADHNAADAGRAQDAVGPSLNGVHASGQAATGQVHSAARGAMKVGAGVKPDAGMDTEIVLGGVPLTHSVEIRESTLLPVFEETAIMFANNQADAAVNILRQAIKDDSLGPHLRQGWAMLFELYTATGRRQDFDALGLEYAARFETSPPAWSDDVAPQQPAAEAAVSTSSIVFPDRLTREHAAKSFDQMGRAVLRDRPADVDFSRVRSVEVAAAQALQKLLVDARKQERTLTLTGLESLRTALQSCVQTGRRDDSDGCWLLLLEVLRLLREQQVFEDTAIDYCVTFEVSPPSWEAMPQSIHVQGGAPSTVMDPQTPALSDDAAHDGTVVWLEGEIVKADTAFAQIRQCAKMHSHVIVDCRRLRRIDFVSAGDLYNEVAQLRSSGHTFEFRALSHLVGCLLIVMSVHEQAELKVRTMA